MNRIIRRFSLAAAVACVSFVASAQTYRVTAEATTIYVDCKSANPVSPYADKASAAKTIAAAMTVAAAAEDAVVIWVAKGTYKETGFTLDKAITIVGETGDPADVIINDAANGKRAFNITSADAVISGLTISGTGFNADGGGGHIIMSAGTVENCVIRDGQIGANSYSKYYGANVHMSGGRLVRCHVLNGLLNPLGGASGYGGIYAGGTAVVESCLVSGNRASSSCSCTGTGVYLDGSAKLVNSTVVANQVTQKAPYGGVYVNSANARVVNTVIFGNGAGGSSDFGNKNLSCFSNCLSSAEISGGTACDVITADDFANYAFGCYQLLANAGYADCGSDDADLSSDLDFAGNPRLSGPHLDIGCYEIPQADEGLTAGGRLSSYGVLQGLDVTCEAVALGGTATGYKWDFGNGDVVESEAASMTYSFPASGLYTVKVAATADGVTWSDWTELQTKAVVVPERTYVDPLCANPQFPYATSNTAARTIAAVFAAMTNNVSKGRPCVDGVTVRLLPGNYTEENTVIEAGVTLAGDTGNPADVVFKNSTVGKRAFTVKHAGARLESVSITGTGLKNGATGSGGGGHLNVSVGTVENCVISGGQLDPNDYSEHYGGNVYMSGGRLVRCQVLSGNANVTGRGDPTSYGCGIYAAGSAIVESCLIANNKVTGSSKIYGTGVCLAGSAKLVNCTVVKNAAPTQASKTGGVYVNSANARVVNTVVFGNGGTSVSEFGNKNGTCFLSCYSSVAIGGAACGTMTAADFASYDAANYALAGTSGLIDAGDNTLLPDGMSDFDLAGEDRVSGETRKIDIGAYEFQQRGLIVSGKLESYGLIAGQTVVCTASVVGGTATGYRWDFGNGDVVEGGAASMTYAFPTSGLFTVKVAATADGVTWSDWTELLTKAVVVPATMYVDPRCANPKFPYATPDTAARTIAGAFAAMTNNVSKGRPCVDGVTVRLLPGDYAEEDVTIDAGVTLAGDTGNPADVVFKNSTKNKRAFTVGHADARLESVSITGTGLNNGATGSGGGGHLNLSAGTVENCVISGGQLDPNDYQSHYGGNVYMSGGRLVRSRVLGGNANAGNRGDPYAYGCGIYAAGSAIVESCLIANNTVGSLANGYGTGVCLAGSARMVNCTVVRNTAPALSKVTSKTGGVYVNSANARVVNTVMFDNGGTAENEFGKQNLGCYGYCASSVANEECATWRVIADAAFKDYAKAGEDVGNLRPSRGGPLHNGGCTREAYAGTGAISEVDLLGGRRIVGSRLDIGCIEGVPPGTVMFVR